MPQKSTATCAKGTTDPEVEAGVVGSGNEKTLERGNNETEKAKTRGDQRNSGYQETTNGSEKSQFSGNDFSGFN